VEAAVADAARTVLATGTPALLEYGISNDSAWEVGLTCGGRLAVFVERLG
jgi:xanthine dehydrogenase accessory factor